MSSDSNVNQLIGLTLKRAEHTVQHGEHRIVLETIDGRSFLFYHSQDCCESVTVDDIAGVLTDLVGAPITEAVEVIDNNEHEGRSFESVTNTTFMFATEKGRVAIKWLGESSGYYSESVSFVETTKGEPNW